MKLHDLMPNPGAKKTGKRKGQGHAAGEHAERPVGLRAYLNKRKAKKTNPA